MANTIANKPAPSVYDTWSCFRCWMQGCKESAAFIRGWCSDGFKKTTVHFNRTVYWLYNVPIHSTCIVCIVQCTNTFNNVLVEVEAITEMKCTIKYDDVIYRHNEFHLLNSKYLVRIQVASYPVHKHVPFSLQLIKLERISAAVKRSPVT